MQETALPCKPYPKQHRDCKRSAAARRTFYDFVSGLCGLNRRAIAGLDRLSSQQNPAYLPDHASKKALGFSFEKPGAFLFALLPAEGLTYLGKYCIIPR